ALFFSSRGRHTRFSRDWSSDVCSSDLLGGIYGGVFTPTEAGAAGAFGAMLVALVKRRLTWAKLWAVIRETGQVSVIILFLIIARSEERRVGKECRIQEWATYIRRVNGW